MSDFHRFHGFSDFMEFWDSQILAIPRLFGLQYFMESQIPEIMDSWNLPPCRDYSIVIHHSLFAFCLWQTELCCLSYLIY